jgi:mono/diheme cytochrome c family protein
MNKILFLVGMMILSACAPALYIPNGENLPGEANLAKLKEGRRLYVAHCGNCHGLHLPGEFSVDAWKENLEIMQKKSKISDHDKDLILTYLFSEPQKN